MDPTDGCGDARPLLEKMRTQCYTKNLRTIITQTLTLSVLCSLFSSGVSIFVFYDFFFGSFFLFSQTVRTHAATHTNKQTKFIDLFFFFLHCPWHDLHLAFYLRKPAPITSFHMLTHAREKCQRKKSKIRKRL